MWALAAAVAAIALGAGLWLGASKRETAKPPADAVSNLQKREFLDPASGPTSLMKWQGKILVVNFWATWCPPCREEIPGLMRSQAKWAAKGLQVVGIAIDSPSNVREFSETMPFNYPVLLGGAETIDVIRGLGNSGGGLPFTLILDRNGGVLATHLGLLSEIELDRILKAALG